MKNRIVNLEPDILPIRAEPPIAEATAPTIPGLAHSIDRLIGMQVIILKRLEQLESQVKSVKSEIQSNMVAYLGWTQEFAGRIK